MKKRIRLLCVILCLIFNNINGVVFGEQATIVFSADCNITVDIYSHIDNACDFSTISDRLELKPNIGIKYKIDVSDFCFVKIFYSNGSQYLLIVQENDYMDVVFKDNKILLSGSNANGNYYLNNTRRYAHVDSIFDLHLKPRIDIAAINADLDKSFWNGFNEDLDNLRNDEHATSEFIKILSNKV